MDALRTIRLHAGRRLTAIWLLGLFLLAQAVPVVALAATDGMAGMACCKAGDTACCRRKPMHRVPSIQAGHPCAMPCCGAPNIVPPAGAAGLAPVSPLAWADLDGEELRLTAQLPPFAPAFDRTRFQRPPPLAV